MLEFDSFAIGSCCGAQDGLELVFFLIGLSRPLVCRTTLGHSWQFKLSKLSCSTASRGLKSEPKHQAALVIHPRALSSPLDAGPFLYDGSFAISLDVRLLRIPSLPSSPFTKALAQPEQTLS